MILIHAKTEPTLQVTPDLNRKYIQDEALLHRYFALQSSNISCSKAAFTLVFISIHSFHKLFQQYGMDIARQALQQINEFLLEQTKNSDLIFQLSPKNKWVFTLPHSGQEEAKYFLERIFRHIPYISAYGEQELSIALSASIVEIANSKSNYEEVLGAGEIALQQALEKGPFAIQMVELFKSVK